MDTPRTTRRDFVQALAVLPGLASGPTLARQPEGALFSSAGLGMLPGLIHLNTGSAGPTTNRVLANTMAAWKQLEADPVVEAYYGSIFLAADTVRQKAAALIRCSADEILFTRGTTDGITTLASSVRLKEGDRVLLSNLEHEGGEIGWRHRERRDGVVLDRVQLPFELHDPDAIVSAYASAIRPTTRVISVSHIIATTGLRMPIPEIAALARSRGILCIVDGAQAVGHIPVNVRSLGCHAYATSGHKWLMGPKGTGFLYIAGDVGDAIQPPQWQLGKQVGADSVGLAPLTMAIGLSSAIEDVHAIGAERIETHNLALAARVRAGMAAIPQLHVVSPHPGPNATALVAAMLPSTIDALAVRERLRERHKVVIKLAEKRWFNGIRLSPHVFNDEGQVDAALAALKTELADWRP